MDNALDDILRLYDYSVPSELIAQQPASPRDAARLLVHRRVADDTSWATFADIGSFLPDNALLVLNETKVIPAKLMLARASGGSVSLLLLGRAGASVRALANRRLKPGEYLTLSAEEGFTVEAADGEEWRLQPSFPLDRLDDVLAVRGHMPLPPYIKHSPLSPSDLRREYQSVFARLPGSIAAPTASLHFTDALLASLAASGTGLARVTLHVHLGTFAPLSEEQWKSGRLHREEYVIDAPAKEAIEAAKAGRRPVIAVGTTVVRTLESAADDAGKIVRERGETELFIREGYRFKAVDGLITNFHVPRSSLLMLVAAFVGREKLLDLYRQAIERRLRFFSFGDAMLLL